MNSWAIGQDNVSGDRDGLHGNDLLPVGDDVTAPDLGNRRTLPDGFLATTSTTSSTTTTTRPTTTRPTTTTTTTTTTTPTTTTTTITTTTQQSTIPVLIPTKDNNVLNPFLTPPLVKPGRHTQPPPIEVTTDAEIETTAATTTVEMKTTTKPVATTEGMVDLS